MWGELALAIALGPWPFHDFQWSLMTFCAKMCGSPTEKQGRLAAPKALVDHMVISVRGACCLDE
jgi:hypothetical protein